jgi:transposase
MAHYKIPKRASYDPSPAELRRLKELVDTGVHASAIFQELRISPSVGRRWLSSADLRPVLYETKSRRRPLNARETAEFLTYYKTSPSRTEIYRKYNIEKWTLEQWLQQLNLEPPKPANARSSISKPLAVVPERGLYQRIKKEEEPRRSIADRFRAQGLATYNPDRE